MNKWDGQQSYEDYKQAQVARSRKKWGMAAFDREVFVMTINTVLPEMRSKKGKIKKNIKNALCLGIRNGNEYLEFKEMAKNEPVLKGLEVYGVDITPEVDKVGDNCFAMDFNHLPSDWENKFELVYSNSLDHAFDVEKTLDEWYRVAAPYGHLILVLPDHNTKVSKCDVYSFRKDDLDKLFKGGRWELVKTWIEPNQPKSFNVIVRVIK